MIRPKEIISILVVSLIFALTISLLIDVITFIYAFISMFIIIFVSILVKEMTAFWFDSEIETNLWEIKQYGFSRKRKFKNAFPAGIFLPLIVTTLSFGTLYWFASLVFEVKPKGYRAAKRHELYSFSEITEWHIGLIASSGIAVCLILAIAGYLAGLEDFAKLSIFYAFFNLLPISNLDGNKIFFGNLVIWSFLTILALIGLGYVFLTV